MLKLPVLIQDYLRGYSAQIDLTIGPFGSEEQARAADRNLIEHAVIYWSGSPDNTYVEQRVVLGDWARSLTGAEPFYNVAAPPNKNLYEVERLIEISNAKVLLLSEDTQLDVDVRKEKLQRIALKLGEYIVATLLRRIERQI